MFAGIVSCIGFVFADVWDTLYIGFVSAAFNSACLAHTGAPCAAMSPPVDASIDWLRCSGKIQISKLGKVKKGE